MNKVIGAGSRHITDYYLIKKAIIESGFQIDEGVCGMARGVDEGFFRFCREKNISVKEFPAEWGKFGRLSGYIRNEQMAKYATHLIAIWDGKSRGTKNMIDLARQYNLNVFVKMWTHED